MPKPPRAPPGGANDPVRPAPDDAVQSVYVGPVGWREALLAGQLLTYTAGRFNELAGTVADAFAFAAEHPGAAMLYTLSATYDAAGSVWDTFAPAIGEALTDINKKVFEEGWFGREVSPREIDVSREPLSTETRMGFRELIAMQAAMLPTTPERADPARHEPEQDGPSM